MQIPTASDALHRQLQAIARDLRRQPDLGVRVVTCGCADCLDGGERGGSLRCGRDPPLRDLVELDGDRCGDGEALERCRQALVGERSGKDALRDHAQLVDGLPRYFHGAAQQLGCVRIGVRSHAQSDHLQSERQRHQALLGTVVQVTLDATALDIPGGDEPLARCPDVGDARAQLGLEPLVLQREPSGCGNGFHQPPIAPEALVVDQRGKGAVLSRHQGDCTGTSGGREVDGMA